MLIWIFIAAIALISGAALFYAGRLRAVNASANGDAAAQTAHQRALLSEIEEDLASGRIAPADATAAKAELAREVMRTEKAHGGPAKTELSTQKWLVGGTAIAVVAVSIGLYAMLGNPGLPGAPLAARPEEKAANIPLTDAIAKVEQRMQQTPDDIRGWKVLAPIYLKMGRYQDAVTAFRNIVRLEDPVTAASRIDLAEALILAQKGVAQGEAEELLKKAVAQDPGNERARFYLASEATRVGDYERAVTLWQGLIDGAAANAPWLDRARQGLAFAQAGLRGEVPAAGSTSGAGAQNAAPDQDQQEMINGMVEGLAERLKTEGGSVDEWTRLVRSRLVLGDAAQAQKDYDAAKAAYPDPAQRVELDALARQNGLK